MNKLILPFNCNGQKLTKVNPSMFANIRAGSRNYIYASCEFENPVEKAYMIFRQGNREEAMLLENGTVQVPNEFVDKSFNVLVCWLSEGSTVVTNTLRVVIKGGE